MSYGTGCTRCSRLQGLATVLFVCLLFASITSPTLATMEITAFEYHRKFLKPLSLGECCQREVAVNMGNNSYYIEAQKCSLYQKGVIKHVPQEKSDARNVLITSADMVVPHLRLCGGEAASFLGILNSGDCVAIEIASRLTFTDKTMVRAFVGIYQKSMDTLETSSNNLEGMEQYYTDKLYLKERSYGTFEILLVQFRFESVLATQEAKKMKIPTLLMSGYMQQIERRVGIPRNVLIINLSTANHQTFQVQQFKHEDWQRAIRSAEILELNIQRTRNEINTNTNNHHLIYRLHPFLEDKDYRTTLPKDWEEISMLEVQLRQAINLSKKTAKKCRGNKTKLCLRVRELRRKLTSAQAEVHQGRSNWIRMKPEEKTALVAHYKANVHSYNSVIKNLAKNVKEMINKEKKAKKRDNKPNMVNEIPRNAVEQIQRRPRRLRHAGGRHRVRSGHSN